MTYRTPVPPRNHDAQRLLELRGIGKSFGAVDALIDIDLDVYGGEVVGIVGDNGAGKSTLIKILSGVHQHDRGSTVFSGQEVSISDPGIAQRLGIETVHQDLSLCDNLDVVSNLWLGRELRTGGVLDEAAMEERSWMLLRELSARIPFIRTSVSTLSGGQRQTVAIARSLIGNPRLVILDEPTAALDVAQSAEVLNLVERLRERGLGIILISHNIADVLAVADRVVVLRLGRVAGTFRANDATSESVIAAITGASELPSAPSTRDIPLP